MKLTNKLGLPKPIVSALTSTYSITPNRYSVTTVLKDPTNVILSRRHGDEVETDVSEMFWALFGQGFHSVLEKASEDGLLSELFLTASVLPDATLSGQIDLYDPSTKTISDYKTTTVWKVINGEFEDYRKQLMMYAFLMDMNGYEVEKVEAVLALKDHSKVKAKVDPDYPKLPVFVKSWGVTDKELNEIYREIVERLTQIKMFEEKPDEELPVCSQEFRWNDGDRYAVKKKGNKRAIRVFDSEEKANEYLEALRNKDIYEIEVRPGTDKRCLEYCSIAPFCKYYQSLIANENNETVG